LPKQDVYTFIKRIIDAENLDIDETSIDAIQNIYNSDIRSIINFIQLNQNINSELNEDNQDNFPDICIFGFQEIDTRKEAYIYLDSTRNQYWQTVCKNSLKKATGCTEYVLLGTGKQLVGLLILIFVKVCVKRVEDIKVSSIATGLLGVVVYCQVFSYFFREIKGQLCVASELMIPF
jgi:hypothetical protein